MSLLLGCIADDFTGGTDLASMLVKNGMRTLQVVGIPTDPVPDDIEAVVVALKSRTTPPTQAVQESISALRWLQGQGCRQIYFKYCSTFDSTPQGNIGPVSDALLDELKSDFTVACPALPANGRTVYQGHLFVGGTLLSESGMRNHPLTPMTDANLVRVLQAQTPRKVALVDHATVRKGAQAVRDQLTALRSAGCTYAIVDATADDDLHAIGRACSDLALVTGGSGIAQGLPANFGKALAVRGRTWEHEVAEGACAVISGSCSVATNEQVAHMRDLHPSFRIAPMELMEGADVVEQAVSWAKDHLADGPVLVYATASPEQVREAQALLGAEQAGTIVEKALAEIAARLVDEGVNKLVVAGGETSGAVVQRLGVQGLRIGPEIDPGVPWTRAHGTTRPLYLALKSGNFGTPDFFLKAWDRLAEGETA
jgi:3-dehydrotetronate 4-kinase